MNRSKLKSYIRYELSQLSARNGEHEFETLCFELARKRHVSNLQPATGPVQSGGDQGRDFESYKTYLSGTDIGSSAFLALARDDIVVGACTLNKGIDAKIRADLVSIFGAGTRPDRVLYFCEPDLPVARRHRLQQHCRDDYSAALEIFDGQAISDQLADPDTFWIAEHYLSVPSEFFPVVTVSPAYDRLKEHWLGSDRRVQNFADFLDIKLGLRTSVKNQEAKADISGWLRLMRALLEQPNPAGLKQKPLYEIAVGELRGRGSLDPALELVAAFFAEVEAGEISPSGLVDASVLVSYCAGAYWNRESSLSAETIEHYYQIVSSRVESELAGTHGQGDRCILLEARALLANILHPTTSSMLDVQQVIERWQDVINAAQKVPFFPISHVADLIDLLAPFLRDDERFVYLRSSLDEILARQTGEREIADRSLKRSFGYLDQDNLASAIDELHRARLGTFTGDSMHESVSSMLMLAKCYEQLGLHIASRYFAAGAAFVAVSSPDDRLMSSFLPKAGFMLAETFYAAGEASTFVLLLDQFIHAYAVLTGESNGEQVHERFSICLVYAGITRLMASRFAPALVPLLDEAINGWPLAEGEAQEIISLTERPGSPWGSMSNTEIEDAIARDLGVSPFLDLGPEREVVWSALGIRWRVKHTSDMPTMVAALEMIATLQIAQVELARAELVIIPSEANLQISLSNGVRPSVERLPSNSEFAWKIQLPANWEESASIEEVSKHILTIALAVIGEATALNRNAFFAVMDRVFARDLPQRAFSVRPARELMEFALQHAKGFERLAAAPPVQLSRPITPKPEHEEIAWQTKPGPGYSLAKAQEIIANRYRRTQEVLRFSLPRIISDKRIHSVLRELREAGFLDWQILTALSGVVVHEQAAMLVGSETGERFMRAVNSRMARAELSSDPKIKLEKITLKRLKMQADISLPAVLHTWGLRVNTPTPNLPAIKTLLDTRFNHSKDDIPHDDILQLGA